MSSNYAYLEKINGLEEEIKKLKQENHILKNVIHEIPGSIYWKNKQGVYLGRNRHAHHMMQVLGLEKDTTIDTVVGKTDYDIFPKEVADNYKQNDKEVLESQKQLVKEEKMILEDGSEIIQLSIKKPIYNAEGQVVGLVGNTIDITAQKKYEQLEREKTVLEQKQKATEKLAYSMRLTAGAIAHELRTPITSIALAAQGLQKFLPALIEGYNLAKSHQLPVVKFRERQLSNLSLVLESIESQMQSANFIIDLLLQNMHTESIQERNKKKLSMAAMVNEALNHYPFKETERELVHLELNNDFYFYGDNVLIKHVFYNLLKNALFFIKSERKGEIFIWLESDENAHRLYFKDTAKGAPEEVVQHLFEAFYSQRSGGTGIGLAFCKMVIESFNGDLSCKSREGEYMEFILTFPHA